MKSKKLITVILSSFILISAVMPYAFSAVSESADKGVMRENLTSVELVKDMGFGWNLGNTLDVCNADRNGDGKIDENSDNVDETLWGNPKATQELFNQLKADGVKSVRIPITWRDHMGEAPDYKVDEEWMDRVQEVVDYARNAGLYAIINIHHDGGGDPDFGAWICHASKDYDTVIQKYKALWSQIADRFKDYSDYLVFESMNEVGFDDLKPANAFDTLNKINQEFVNLVRQSGGNNDKRHLLIAGYWTDIAKTCSTYFKMPEDPANRCILSVHYYTPWQFCINGNPSTWGSEAEIRELNRLFDMLNDKFISNGVPVIIGEYGVNSAAEEKSRVYWCESVVKKCTSLGIAAFFWDNGEEVDRETYQWRTPDLLKAIKEANLNTSPSPEPPKTNPSVTPPKESDPPKTNPKSSDKSKATDPSAKNTAKTTAVSVPSDADKAKKTAEANMSKAKIKRLKVKSKSKNKITVQWKKVKNAKGYNVQVSKKSSFKNKLFNKYTSKNKITFQKKIKSKKTYFIRVRAYCTYKKANGDIKKVFSGWNKKIRKIKVK